MSARCGIERKIGGKSWSPRSYQRKDGKTTQNKTRNAGDYFGGKGRRSCSQAISNKKAEGLESMDRKMEIDGDDGGCT